MASEILVDIKEEVTCPICLELLTEPLILPCGHSFCQTCITSTQKESVTGQKVESICPVCRISYQPRNIRSNWHLANIVERIRMVKARPEEEQKRDVCVHHKEKLLLFCKEDGKVICCLCEHSQEHQGHHIFPMEEVAQEYQEKLQAALVILWEDQQEAEKLEAEVREETISWKKQLQSETQRVQAEFKQMRDTLDSEEQKVLLKLKNAAGDILHNRAEAESELVQQSKLVRALISDVEHRLQGSTMEMLQDVNDIMKRSDTWTLKRPKMVSKKLKSAFRVSDLSRMLQMSKELTEVQRYWVDMMLNPVYTTSNIVVSVDQRQVRVPQLITSKNTESCEFSDFDVLGHQCFFSGKYYWEVDVSEKIAWILGICSRESYFNRKYFDGLILSADVNQKNVYSRYSPQYGYWVIGLQNGSEYNAFEDSFTCSPKVLSLPMAVPPRVVGIFLDYEACTVSFFNVTNRGSLIYKFSKCHFFQTVYPYFNPWNCPGPITLCPPSS